MPPVIGLDLGTTTVTALVLDPAEGRVSCVVTEPAALPSPGPPGRREWVASSVLEPAFRALRRVANALGLFRDSVAGLAITGQQHGVVVYDPTDPEWPGFFVNWQDRRGEEPHPAGETFTAQARQLLGAHARHRHGCLLHPGFLAVTLFHLRESGLWRDGWRTCFLPDYLAARLTGGLPVTDATLAGSSGIFYLAKGDWDNDALAALGLSRDWLPPVRPTGELLGPLTAEMAGRTGLRSGLPLFVPLGDNQASFLGSVADRDESVLVNVGTGGQVSVWSPEQRAADGIEVRAFPGGGYLLVAAGLTGGAAFATLGEFFRQTGEKLFDVPTAAPPLPVLVRLAANVPAGADGLRCGPFFSGSRADPTLRGEFTGLMSGNFTPGHLARAVLEGMARTFADNGRELAQLNHQTPRFLIGPGNGIRSNPLLASIVAQEFGLPMSIPIHAEEAAMGAAQVAAVGAGLLPDLPTASRFIHQGTR